MIRRNAKRKSSDFPFSTLEEQAISAAIAAGKATLNYRNSDTLAVKSKADKSPVTEADQHAHRIITEAMKDSEFPVVSEEGEIPADQERLDWNCFWLVDPLDGTKEFIRGSEEYTVNIGRVEKGSPVFGVIYVPVKGWLYIGKKAKKIWLKLDLNGVEGSWKEILDQAIELRADQDLKRPHILTSRSHPDKSTQAFHEWVIDQADSGSGVTVTAVGSSLKFCYLAEGQGNLFFREGRTMEWDTAAGQAICEAAGIGVFDNRTRQALSYNKEHLANGGFYCVGPAWRKKTEKGVKEVISS